MKTKLLVMLLAVLFALSASAGAAPEPLPTLEKGPYLIYTGTNTEMMVLWQLEAERTCTLEWGLDESCVGGSATTTELDPGSDPVGHQHEHVITELTPGTKYYYQVTDGDDTYPGSFTAAPGDVDAIKILAFGDTRSQPKKMNEVTGQMINTYTEPDSNFQTIALHSGDWVNSNSELDWSNEFFHPDYANNREFQANMPIAGCRGNHEGGASLFAKYYPYPYASLPYVVDDPNGFYWSFDYGPIHVVMIDDNISYAPGSDQHNWLIGDLAGTEKLWKIAVYHSPAWGTGWHSNDTNAQRYLHDLLFTVYNVPIIINGDNHNYVRCEVEGIRHITSGGGGAPLYAVKESEPYVVTATRTYHHCEIDIDGGVLNLIAVDSAGKVIDNFSITHSSFDEDSPTPNPMEWLEGGEPCATGDSSIAMVAATATDDNGVEYYFTCTTDGGNDSGWQDDTFYEDTGLMHETEYTYTVTARDTSLNYNETGPSGPASAMTHIEDTVTPTPDPMTWNSAPDGTSTSTISMTATTASDTSGVEYYFECTEGSGHDSGWQDSPTYEDTGLMYGTQYTYKVKARDKCSNHNETGYSGEASATTLTGPALWTSKAVYAPNEDIVVNFVDAAGNEEDWIGLSVDGTSDESYLTYQYLNGSTSGSKTFSGRAGEGAYEARLFFRGSYKLEAFFDFTVADTTPPTLEAPSVLSATAISTTQIDLSWTDNASDETGFKIERSERVNTAFAQIATVGGDVTVYHDTGLKKGTTYHYRVRATNASGDSAYSNEISAMTLKR